ncbi:fas apoptotic inhibitory molecule 1 [Eurytemora carolleeae]|uniref:fas apoptotic inhibitory molecule 1 n=1 Tax=Eurytemora carolleeae TaxID=1294199 RepID=UPI000C784380|nr:fas apoptotic inhibitory molecule 1 [Eurytemora carolleeae]|eukprot:XP_023338740.1 fas apoptotic inhibitory molecule 1-like [Eurytemora affinis]
MVEPGSDLVAVWEVQLPDGIHLIQFEHGTTSGKRILWIDRKEVMRRDWMFKLVGTETFTLGKSNSPCSIKIEPVGGFNYQYSLEVAGKPYKKFLENQTKIMKTWILPVDGNMYRIVLEKDTLDIWVNGTKVEMAGEFTDDGTETHFTIGNEPACVRAISSGHKRGGIIHSLWVHDVEVPEYTE